MRIASLLGAATLGILTAVAAADTAAAGDRGAWTGDARGGIAHAGAWYGDRSPGRAWHAGDCHRHWRGDRRDERDHDRRSRHEWRDHDRRSRHEWRHHRAWPRRYWGNRYFDGGGRGPYYSGFGWGAPWWGGRPHREPGCRY